VVFRFRPGSRNCFCFFHAACRRCRGTEPAPPSRRATCRHSAQTKMIRPLSPAGDKTPPQKILLIQIARPLHNHVLLTRFSAAAAGKDGKTGDRRADVMHPRPEKRGTYRIFRNEFASVPHRRRQGLDPTTLTCGWCSTARPGSSGTPERGRSAERSIATFCS